MRTEARETAAASPPTERGARRRGLAALGPHWPLLAVLAAFALTALVVPTLAPVSVSDDALYARTMERLFGQHELRVLPLAQMTLVFQVGWAGLFGLLFGDSLGVFRVSTVVMTMIGGGALYALCRELGVDRGRSALGAAVYLFNPLTYVLGFSFMTDGSFAAMLIVAVAVYVRGLRREPIAPAWVLAGSVAASAAFLIRQQGALIPLGVATSLLVSRVVRFDRAGLRMLARVLLVPALTIVGYYLWFNFVHGVPRDAGQAQVAEGWASASPVKVVGLVASLSFVQVMYIGLFTLPIVASALFTLGGVLRNASRRVWIGIGLWTAVIGAGLLFLGGGLARMPYGSQFLNTAGLGPDGDLRGGRVPIYGARISALVTALCAGASIALAVFFVCRVEALKGRRNVGAGVVLAVLVWQALGAVAPSLPLASGAVTRDRYLLPLAPLAVALALWALRNVRFPVLVAWLVTASIAVFSVAATHDFLGYEAAAWKLGREAHAEGVAYRRIEGGAAWDAYHLYEYSVRNKIQLVLPKGLRKGPLILSDHDIDPWWLGLYGAATTSDYVIASEPLYGFTVVKKIGYSDWLRGGSGSMYLLRHAGVQGPP